MFKIGEESIEWSLKHVGRYYSSDFFPAPFEFSAIKHAWDDVKGYLLGLDLEQYVPKGALTTLAPKANGTFRVVHQLDPLDSLIYTALVYELNSKIEGFRIPATEGIACSYRIKPDVNGSFFSTDEDGWNTYISRTKSLAKSYSKGYVATCDIVDFYNQIYTHRIRNVLSEAGGSTFETAAKVTEEFILAINTQTSRGVPVGPAASILLAEAIMADIDRKILGYTRDFVRWVDDIRVFFGSKDDARWFLHELTQYMYENHRLVFSGEKTKIIPVSEFGERYFKDDKTEERKRLKAKTEELALEEYYEELWNNLGPYDSPDEIFDPDEFQVVLEKVADSKRFEILSNTYKEMLTEELDSGRPDIPLLRRIFRNASKYRIRSIIPVVLSRFEDFAPVVREVSLYFRKVITDKVALDYEKKLEAILTSAFGKIPYVNMWISFVLQDDAFNKTCLPTRYDQVVALRDRALIARRKQDRTWVKSCKAGLDVLGPWERRAILYSSTVLSRDEMAHWLRIASARGDVLEKAVASYTANSKKE